MNILKLWSIVFSMLLVSCGINSVSHSTKDSQLTDTSSKADCESIQELAPVAGSEFPKLNTSESVLRISKITALSHCFLSGFGWRINSWTVKYSIEVKNLAFEKRFVIDSSKNASQFNNVLDPSQFHYRGQTDDGFDKFEIEMEESSLTPKTIAVIMPAKYNSTPNISAPMPGWYGPKYGITVDSIKQKL
ncbi:MAG: hypothetical protein NT027_12555 [Proteobacteria bacterium]|nr:hypothetical protein [Pseudomonadota bacterium]